jgi:hypothetical protein
MFGRLMTSCNSARCRNGTAWLFPLFEVGAPELNHKKLSRLGGAAHTQRRILNSSHWTRRC